MTSGTLLAIYLWSAAGAVFVCVFALLRFRRENEELSARIRELEYRLKQSEEEKFLSKSSVRGPKQTREPQ